MKPRPMSASSFAADRQLLVPAVQVGEHVAQDAVKRREQIFIVREQVLAFQSAQQALLHGIGGGSAGVVKRQLNSRDGSPSQSASMKTFLSFTAVVICLGFSAAPASARDKERHHADDHARAHHDAHHAREDARHARAAAHRAAHSGSWRDFHHAQHDARRAAASRAKAHASRHHAEHDD